MRFFAVFDGIESDLFGDARKCLASIPKGLHHSAHGWPDSARAYRGSFSASTPTLKRVAYEKFGRADSTLSGLQNRWMFILGSSFLATQG
jgi:hypothetical protein